MIMKAQWYEHQKGGVYLNLCNGLLEKDRTQHVVYVSGLGPIWIRPYGEFHDGRFQEYHPGYFGAHQPSPGFVDSDDRPSLPPFGFARSVEAG